MSRLDDLMAADLAHLIEDGSDLGVDGVFKSGTGEALLDIRLIFTDPTDTLVQVGDGTDQSRVAPCLTRLSLITDHLGRPPQPSDRIIIAAGCMAGEWSITSVVPDQGDGCNLTLRLDGLVSAGRTTR